MASLFQLPTSGDPVLVACNLANGTSGRLVYCNRALAPEVRLQSPLQYFTLVFAATCVAVPLIIWLCIRANYIAGKTWRRRDNGGGPRQLPLGGNRKHSPSPLLKRRKPSYSPPAVSLKILSQVQSIRFLDEHVGISENDLTSLSERDACIIRLPSFSDDESTYPTILTLDPQKRQSPVLGLLHIDAVTKASLPVWTSFIANLVLEDKTVSAVVIRKPDATKEGEDIVHDLIWRLQDRGIPIILECGHDDGIFDHVELRALAGIIIDNACILSNGERRDYFRSYRLRDILNKCAYERGERPGFFVAFHDRWDVQPTAAVVSRAEKVARHFEAVYEQGPDREHTGWPERFPDRLPQSTSGFEFLRKAETSLLQKAWIQQTRKVHVGPNIRKNDDIACLKLRELRPILPNVDVLLKVLPLPEDLESLRTEQPPSTLPPDYLDQAPSRHNFWDFSPDGEEMSRQGCIPLICSGSEKQFIAILGAQIHLKDLNMLHQFDELEVEKFVDQLRQFQSRAKQPLLIGSLIEGLIDQNVAVYKGLSTGFTVPDNNARFWSVSTSRDDNRAVDIFISRSCPSDLSTILHSWLAYNGISRVDRFEEELALEKATTPDSDPALPLSIKAAIEQATPAEALLMLQQLQVARLQHPFRVAMEERCKTALLDEASAALWNDAHCRCFLEGTVSIEDLIERRLGYFVRLGATQVPSVDNLLQLYEQINSIINNALFYGDVDTLNAISNPLLHAYDPENAWTDCNFVDINTDLTALMFFCALRQAALENVYIEATDHCPFFSSQPDQAAVFSELWVLGSQCELYFGMAPRALGKIVHDRYRTFLQQHPPPLSSQIEKGLMSVYAKPEPEKGAPKKASEVAAPRRKTSRVEDVQKTFIKFGALSIFCLPAIVDIVLLTFVGRGLFMTAFMGQDNLTAACLALLLSLLLSAGVTGWVGSVGNYYLSHYAFNNMVYFHVQRLSGGFVLSLLVGIVGVIVYSIQISVGPAFVFLAYVALLSTYLNVLGIMATMHQRGSPLTSGRTVLWRTIPLLFISPVISTFINGYDLIIYLTVGYVFLMLLLFQYRQLCHEWVNWIDNIPTITEKDIVTWYSSRMKDQEANEDSSQPLMEKTSEKNPDHLRKLALQTFRENVESYRQNVFSTKRLSTPPDSLVRRVERGLPYIEWLLKTDNEEKEPDELFCVSWFAQLDQAVKKRRSMAQGLKEHSIFLLFRYARLDIGQNVALFLIFLMDRWVSIVMAVNSPPISLFSDFTSRYAICFAILYFCASVMTLDATLEKYWQANYKLSHEKLSTSEDAIAVAQKWESARKRRYLTGLLTITCRVMVILGCATICVWTLVSNMEALRMYYLYCLAYSAVIMMQFNRCFTTNIKYHITSLLVSAAAGFITGCVLHGIYRDNPPPYLDVLALNVTAGMAAILTSLWAWKDYSLVTPNQSSSGEDNAKIWKQPTLARSDDPSMTYEVGLWRSLPGVLVASGQRTTVSQTIPEILRLSAKRPSQQAVAVPWATDLLEVASEMWKNNRIRVNLCSRSTFIDAGLENCISFSKLEDDVLFLTVGFLGEDELNSPSWQLLSAHIIVEAVLYHTSRAVVGLSSLHAVQAEHFLPDTDLISRRIDFQIALEDKHGLQSIMRRTNTKLLKHLCLGIDIDSQWGLLPRAVREAIVSRVVGEPMQWSQAFGTWAEASSIDVQEIDFHVALCLRIYNKASDRLKLLDDFSSSDEDFASSISVGFAPHDEPVSIIRGAIGLLKCMLELVIIVPATVAKWIAIISGAGSNIERELWYSLRHHKRTRDVTITILLFIWRLCWHMKNAWTYTVLVYDHKALVNISRLARKGASRTLHKNSVVVELRRKTVTGFLLKNEEVPMMLEIFGGTLSERPEEEKPASTAEYDAKCRLVSRMDKAPDGQVSSTYTYRIDNKTRFPTSKNVIRTGIRKLYNYDKKGRVTNAIISLGTAVYSVQYFYKSGSKRSHEVLKAKITAVKPPTAGSLTVYWGVPLREDVADECNWVPSDRVCRVMKDIADKVYVTTSDYQHRRDPVMVTTVSEEGGAAAVVSSAPRLFEHEELLQQRPSDVSFENDDLLIYHTKDQIRRMAKFSGMKLSWASLLNPAAWQYWRKKVVYRKVPTWWLRTELWNHWRKTGTLDAITACWVDELILREEPLLDKYWSARGSGQLSKAKKALNSEIDQIVAAIEIEKDVSEVCMLPIKSADLYAMGLGKDANHVTTRPEDCFKDTNDRISVIFNDIGCWPESPGGVSNCRRDLVNGHSTIRNHVLAESANEYGIPRFQVEKNVQSLKVIPLWGLDGRTPNHGVIDNLLEAEVDKKIANTDARRDIVGTFVPLLRLFVKGARSKHISRSDMHKYSNAVFGIFRYFERKDYNKTWESKEVATAWADAWLTRYDDPDINDPADYFELEKPTMSDFRDTLAIYTSYFFIFSVQTPENCPKVFQSTHHGISSLFGMLLKYRRGATFGIWDHAILWRECCLNISPAQSTLPLPVQSMLLSGIGLAMRLAYFHADVVLPCTPVFNPIWEADLGTDNNRLEHSKKFSRKIDPIVNGVSNMDAFQPVDEVRSTTPTVVMLSNVQFIKDIKTAILAADVIVNKFGFHDYRLLIYGARDREPDYDIDMARLIESCNLTNHVILKGFGKPSEILKDAWLFMNSSLSEGLPLAVAEAALAGVPIVATAVGATALVLTDPEDPSVCYGEVVPPNDPTGLARAQIAMLAMAGPWAKFAGDVDKRGSVLPSLVMPDVLAEHEVKWLTKRMHEKKEARRHLGMLSRKVVLRGFHGKRYLREHEQMYWVQWHLAQMRGEAKLAALGVRVGDPGASGTGTGTGTGMGTRSTSQLGFLSDMDVEGDRIVWPDEEQEERERIAAGGDIKRKVSVKWQEFPPSRVPYRGKRLSKIRERSPRGSGGGRGDDVV
ncbi:hypothetical protein B0T17DRAFT_657349 [Bombardia bombarda]|uniref:Glycosyl transferase n=1 Tax=Bombardia bombarda TaxID=252184 RepID=A0AA40BVG4_9PEZI|nr:hypothetical protein B0T17DRAFT_657349 [Bombardia bombarda]